MSARLDDPQNHRFAGWEIRPHERVLLVRGAPVKVGGRAFDLLLALVNARGKLVGKDELLDAAWPGLVVEENNLSVQVTALRKLIGAEAIVSVAGRGYQLAARPLEDNDGGAPVRAAPAVHDLAQDLVGRDAELQAITRLVGRVPVVTIVGTGGVGKTSLARAVAASLADRWRDGVRWVELGPVSRPAQLVQALAKALGVTPSDFAPRSEDLLLALSRKQCLVVLDNCEHLLDELTDVLAPLLRAATGLSWLATSREPLHLFGESLFRLGPLDVPTPGTPPEQALAHGAMALFCARARTADWRFELRADQIDTAIQLCRRLDGLPLAIEMAAARVTTLGLKRVHDDIDGRLGLQATRRDAPGRHQTLLNTFDWSYGLLSPVEQQVFRRMEPFRGSFSLAMAQRLCSWPMDGLAPLGAQQSLDALARLIDKSLIQRRGAEGATAPERLHLLESARDYARLRLGEAQEIEPVRAAHAEVVAHWFDDAHVELQRSRDQDWGPRYVPERQNVAAALGWVCGQRLPELLARLVAALALLDNFAQTQAEVVSHPVPLDVLEAAPKPLRALAYLEWGWAQFFDGSRELGTKLVLQALADYETLGDAAGTYLSLVRLIRLYHGRPGMLDAGRAMWERLQTIDEREVPLRMRLHCQSTVAFLYQGGRTVERLQQLRHVAQRAGFGAIGVVCGTNITDELLVEGRFEEAAEVAQEVLDGSEPWVRPRAMIHHNRALALVRLGRFDEARVAANEMLRALPSAAHMIVDLYAFAASRAGRHEDAALMAGCSERIKRERDRRSEAAEAAVIAETLASIDQALGAVRRIELMRLGADLPVADVLAMSNTF